MFLRGNIVGRRLDISVDKAHILNGGIVAQFFKDTIGIGEVETADEVAVAVEMADPPEFLIGQLIAQMVPRIFPLYGFCLTVEQTVVEPDVLCQLEVFVGI